MNLNGSKTKGKPLNEKVSDIVLNMFRIRNIVLIPKTYIWGVPEKKLFYMIWQKQFFFYHHGIKSFIKMNTFLSMSKNVKMSCETLMVILVLWRYIHGFSTTYG